MLSDAVPKAASDARRVAVFDDDIRFIRLVERILRPEQVEVQPITTLDIDEAIRVLCESDCDAAIIDVYMYGSQTGFTLVERLREDPATADLPIIVASGARREIGRKFSFLQENRCGVLVKPFEIEELISKVRTISAPRITRLEIPPPPQGFSGALQRLTAAVHGS
jgi:CheY-like chemotaxis protein